jgi:hypothetical protein
VGLIFLGLGSQAGLLNSSLEAAILLMVIGTTFLAPILLRLVIKTPPSGDPGGDASGDAAADADTDAGADVAGGAEAPA